MKVLLIFPSIYSVDKTFKRAFEDNGCTVHTYDYRKHVRPLYEKIENKKLKISHNWRKKWEDYYFKKINQLHLNYFFNIKPDIVLIYNNEMLLPETVKEFKKSSKIFFFLGDSPFYSPTSKYNLNLLFMADQVLCPDTGWQQQLKILGLDNTRHFVITSGMEENYKKNVTKDELEKYGSDIVFIGGNVDNSWGYKKSLFLNSFTRLDFKLYGPPSWNKWFDFFPDLKKCLVPHKNGRLSFELVNTIMNCCKIYPVDVNPGLINGPHLRVYECINSGILPLVEYRKDLDIIFNGVDIPVIKNYKNAEKSAKKYLEDESLRVKTIEVLIKYMSDNLSPRLAIQKLIASI